MNTDYKVFWSSEAERNLAENISYLEENWGIQAADHFLQIVNTYEQIIANNPELYPESPNLKGYRRCVVTKQISIYYKIEGDHIKIYSLWNTLQDPDNLNL